MHTNSSINSILNEIMKHEDKVFSSSDFLNICEYDNIRQSLSRLEKQGIIKKVIRGFYYKPIYSELLNEYSLPSPYQTALAIARKYNWIIIPSKNTALNELGLSSQVSNKYSFISDGPYRKFMIGEIEIEFKHTSKRLINNSPYKINLIIQALDALKNNITQDQINIIMRQLNANELNILLNETKTKINIYNIIKKINLSQGELNA